MRQLISRLRLSFVHVWGVLATYYSLTLICALLDGIGMVFLVTLFTNGAGVVASKDLPEYIWRIIEFTGISASLESTLFFLTILYGVNLSIRFGLLTFDGWLAANLRRRLQERMFRHYLAGDWAHMRTFSTGSAVGCNTQEAMIVAKYLISAISTGYFLIGTLVLGGLAAITSLKIFIAFGAISFPLALIMRAVISRQSLLSRRSADLRNSFSADIADRFNGLFQINIESNAEYHVARGLRTQPELTRLETLIGICQAVLGSFNLILPFACLLALSLWIGVLGAQGAPNLTLAASVAILGIRLANQLNGVVGSLGNLSRLSGSIFPVLGALDIPSAPERGALSNAVSAVHLREVSYSFGAYEVLKQLTLIASRGMPLMLVGRSGAGKTTLANLIAGLYFPMSGDVAYIDAATGKEYSSRFFRARVGYVTQDIYLFHGALRDNLVSGRAVDDSKIWRVLEMVGAAEFVREIGGLDVESADAGRSLSGGQRRRIGIARVLLSECDILIFDEITAGLDQQNRKSILALMSSLAGTHVLIFISHDEIQLPGQTVYSL
jgi:ABC-type bacteriocin/lantibiotic exporter with double-glycine peptidase domain